MNSLVFVLGLIFGSFLGVIIDRLPQERNIVAGRSMCDTCERSLEWIDLIPLVSFIMFKGRCRRCKTKLSYRYPLLELITGSAYLMAFHVFGLSYMSLVAMILASVLIVIAFIDIDTMIIYDRFHVILLALGAIVIALNPSSLMSGLLGFVIVSVPYLILAIVTQGIGGGDVKLIASAGLMLGASNTVLAFVLSTLVGGVYGVILILGKKVSAKDAIPFGPFLCIGIYTSFLYGDKIVSAYLSLF